MAIKNIIAHKMLRPNTASDAHVQYAEQAWPLNEQTEDLARALKQSSLKRSGKEYGAVEPDHPIASALRHFFDDGIALEDLSQQLLSSITSKLNASEGVLDGNIILFSEEIEAGKVLHGYFVEQKPMQFINDELQLENTQVLDTSQINFGFKINARDFLSDEQEKQLRAIQFLRARSDKILSKAIQEGIGFGDKTNIGSETETLLETVTEYTSTLPDDVASFAKEQVVNYCLEQEKSGEPVAIKALSNNLAKEIDEHQASFSSAQNGSYTPPQKFENFALSSEKEVKQEVIADKNKLRNYVRISGRNEELSMSFSTACLGSTIVYDAGTDNLVIKSIPNSLKSRLIKHVQSA